MYLTPQATLFPPYPMNQFGFNNGFSLNASLGSQSAMSYGTSTNSLSSISSFASNTSFPAVPAAYSEDSGSSSSLSSTKDFQFDTIPFFSNSSKTAPSLPTYNNLSSSYDRFNTAIGAKAITTPSLPARRRLSPGSSDSINSFGKQSSQIQQEVFARKVFVGGLPIDVREEEIWQTFNVFGNVLVDWPRRPDSNNRHDDFGLKANGRSMTGYVFLVFEEEVSVRRLIDQCHKDGDKYYLFVSSPTMRAKPVQVRPWKLADMEYMRDPSMPLDPRRTVFIGGVPRPTRANELAECLNNLYGSVCYVGIDIDPELKYPKGAARVTFSTTQAFIAAISGRFVHVHHAETQKRVEIKPYVMDEQMCDECQGKKCLSRYAPYFCGDVGCLQYYCETCWDKIHLSDDKRCEHRPLVRMGDQTKALPRPPHHMTSTKGTANTGRATFYSRNSQ